MGSTELQKIFFGHIKSKVPSNVSFAETIANVLNISTDSAYRRIRGEKLISFEEIKMLSTHFQISVDKIMSINSDSIIFSGRPIENENFDLPGYLHSLQEGITSVKKAGSKTMYYEAKDVPVFCYFPYDELAAFKYFFWMKTILSYSAFSKLYYEDNDLTSIIRKPGIEITRTYNNVPSAEIWGIDSINATLEQIKYYKYSGIFRKEESIDLLLSQLEMMVDHIRDQAESGEKFLPGEKPNGHNNYQLFFNEVFLGNNSVYIETDGIQSVHINYGVFNYMTTFDSHFCSDTKRAFENTMKKSSLISSVSEKERNRFFNILKSRIRKVKDDILV